MAPSSTESTARRAFGEFTLLSVGVLALFSASAGCGQEFTSCSETHSCGEEGGSSGSRSSGSGGSSSGSGGAAGESGSLLDECPGGCDDGETCCDGECVDTSSDAANCGECGNACLAAHADSECVDSECSIARCWDGYVDCSSKDGCETQDEGLPSVPAPFWPVAGAYTGAFRAESSLKPRFAWRASEEAGTCAGLTYELELTRECAPGELQECEFEEAEVHEVGLTETEWTPSDPLPVSDEVPVGALYAWRVRACEGEGNERCSKWSRVSYVNVGRLIDDINADGYSDLVEVGDDDEVKGVFLLGDGATPLAAFAPIELELGLPTHGRLLGDVNGDSFPDMVLWSWGTGEAPRVVLGASTLAGWTSKVMPGALQTYHRGGRTGDLDADGFADVAISEFDLASVIGTPKGVVRLYRGGAKFDLVGPSNLLPPEGTTVPQFGAALAGGFDTNADGYADLVIMDDDEGALHFVRGQRSFPPSIDASIESPALVVSTSSDYTQVFGIGDPNGDGHGDIGAFVRTGSGGLFQAFFGGPEPSPVPTANIPFGSNMYSVEWFGGHDFGGDGRDDLFLHVLESIDAASQVRALPGSSDNRTEADLIQVGTFGHTSAFAGGFTGGDYDGDGVLDLKIRTATQIRLVRGGKPAALTGNCDQPESSFPLIGDWCSLETSILTTPPYDAQTPVR